MNVAASDTRATQAPLAAELRAKTGAYWRACNYPAAGPQRHFSGMTRTRCPGGCWGPCVWKAPNSALCPDESEDNPERRPLT
jgi:hypothetical protein